MLLKCAWMSYDFPSMEEGKSFSLFLLA